MTDSPGPVPVRRCGSCCRVSIPWSRRRGPYSAEKDVPQHPARLPRRPQTRGGEAELRVPVTPIFSTPRSHWSRGWPMSAQIEVLPGVGLENSCQNFGSF